MSRITITVLGRLSGYAVVHDARGALGPHRRAILPTHPQDDSRIFTGVRLGMYASGREYRQILGDDEGRAALCRGVRAGSQPSTLETDGDM